MLTSSSLLLTTHHGSVGNRPLYFLGGAVLGALFATLLGGGIYWLRRRGE